MLVLQKEIIIEGSGGSNLTIHLDDYEEIAATLLLGGIIYSYSEKTEGVTFRGPDGLITDEKLKGKIIRKIRILVGKGTGTPPQIKSLVWGITNGIKEQGRIIG